MKLKALHTAILAATLALPCGWAAAADEWTRVDTQRQAIFTGLMVVDYRQTVEGIVKRPGEYVERNTVLGPYPSKGRISTYFALTVAGHYAVARLLPASARFFGKRWNPRAAWQHVGIVVEAGAVHNNIRVGLSIGF